MSQLEYLTVLVSIIVGLGVTDLAKSVRDLLHPDQPVRWHWLPLTWALAAILMVVGAWWGLYRFLQADVWTQPAAFLLILFMSLCLYLLCAFALPELDGPPETDDPDLVDLEAFYFSPAHRRSFFGISILYWVSLNAIAFIWKVSTGTGDATVLSGVQNVLINGLILGIPLGLMILTERKWVHVFLTIVGFLLVVWLLLEFAPFLTAG